VKVYLDNAATTPIDPQVIDAMIPIMKDQFGNPSSIHSYGRTVKAHLEQSRKTIASLLNCAPSEIFFTSGGTEANNMAIGGAIRDLGVRHIITSAIEHHAVLHTAEFKHQYDQVRLSFVKLLPNGHIDLQDLEQLLANNEKSLVSLMHANNEVGNLLPMQAVADLCNQYNAIFHSDTVQTMGHYAFDLQKTKVHFLTCAAHKFHGPKGVGFLYISSDVKIKPFIFGGAQERNMRGGTENVYGIVGLAKALTLCYQHLNEHTQHISQLKNYMAAQLQAIIPDIKFNGDCTGQALYTVLNVSFPQSEYNETILFNLDMAGIACSGGSACSSGSNVGSHVLGALGVDPSRANVRFSFSKFTTKAEIDFTLQAIKELFLANVS
jgi:cysteine desulfurase